MGYAIMNMRWKLLLLSCLAMQSVAVCHEPPKESLADKAEQQAWDSLITSTYSREEINVSQPDGMTALHWACFYDHVPSVKALIAAGANVNAPNQYGITPLLIACTNGNASIAHELLSAGADVNARRLGGETALMVAARTGKLSLVEALLDRRADVHAHDHRKQTAVMWGAAEGHTDVVGSLIFAGADYKTPLDSGFTPLFFAIREGHTETALALLDLKGVDINEPMTSSKRTRAPNPLLLAVENGHFETALALLRRGADPNAQPAGHGALHAITWVRKPLRGDGDPAPVGSGNLSSLALVSEMLDAGADVNLPLERGQKGFADFTTTGATPLILAARTGDLPLVKLLLDHGADPKRMNLDDSSALLAAAGIGDLGSGHESAGTESEAIEVIELLLKQGLDINHVDRNGETAMHGAAYQNWPRLIHFLSEHGAKLDVWNQRNRWGWTPLMIAHGYREGNFRPDPKTISAIESIMSAAGVTPPKAFDADLKANQQSWDKPQPKEKPKTGAKQPTANEAAGKP